MSDLSLSLFDDVVVMIFKVRMVQRQSGISGKKRRKMQFNFWSDTYQVKRSLFYKMAPAASMLSEHKTLSATISLYDKLVGDANLNQSPLQKRRKKGKEHSVTERNKLWTWTFNTDQKMSIHWACSMLPFETILYNSNFVLKFKNLSTQEQGGKAALEFIVCQHMC